MKKTFYAATHYYGINIANDYNNLFRFPTKAARDEFVDAQQLREAASGNLKTEALTRAEAVRHFANAFREVGYYHEVTDSRDWISHDGGAWSYWNDANLYYSNYGDQYC